MKVAIVGSGVSGLAAAWVLATKSEHEVHLYESDSRFGGHANTITFQGDGEPVDVDTGFIALNPLTYPNFFKFLCSENIPLQNTKNTLSVSRDDGAFEWAGHNLRTVFAQARQVFNPRMWRMLYDILRFNACARTMASDDAEDLPIGEYLRREGYSDAFRDDYLIPMTASLWSTPADAFAMDFPTRTLVRFMRNHHLLQTTGGATWLTIKGGSRLYVERILSMLPAGQKHIFTPVVSVSSSPTSSTVCLTTNSGEKVEYDHVIMACHTDATLKILGAGEGLTQAERDILGRFKWTKNSVVAHHDVSLMPKRKTAWACWNFLARSTLDENGAKKANEDRVSMTFLMNSLQGIPMEKHGPVLITLDTPRLPSPDKVCAELVYHHPLFNFDAIAGQRLLPQIQNVRRITYAGAWTRYGFHEDGFASGIKAASHLLSRPFKVLEPVEELDDAWFWRMFFDLIEKSGARMLLGAILAKLITLLGLVLIPFFEQRQKAEI